MAEPRDTPRFTTQAGPPPESHDSPPTSAMSARDSESATQLPPEAQAPGPLPGGGTLGPYDVIGEIARGGMGVVYRCRDRVFNRELAVKVMLDRYAGREDVLRRFTEEARIAGQLQHPGVVPVHELGALPDGRPFMAMKLVKGRTLAELLGGRGPPAHDLPRFLEVFEQACQAVAYAHAKGVIHRDLKPANLMVGAFGEVQVMDWGLAKVLTEDAAG